MRRFGGAAHVVGACVIALLVLLPRASSERLPMHIFTTADRLAHNRVNRIQRDSRGFIWFCTDDGLSRWNGYEFQSYTRSEGLPHAHINDFLETSRGRVLDRDRRRTGSVLFRQADIAFYQRAKVLRYS